MTVGSPSKEEGVPHKEARAPWEATWQQGRQSQARAA